MWSTTSFPECHITVPWLYDGRSFQSSRTGSGQTGAVHPARHHLDRLVGGYHDWRAKPAPVMCYYTSLWGDVPIIPQIPYSCNPAAQALARDGRGPWRQRAAGSSATQDLKRQTARILPYILPLTNDLLVDLDGNGKGLPAHFCRGVPRVAADDPVGILFQKDLPCEEGGLG